MSIILAIDCGTTSTRVLAFDQNQTIVHTEQRDLPLEHPQPDWVEQCPSTLWKLTKECLDACIQHIGTNNIHAIGITNQRETCLLWDMSTGTPIGPAISWQCRRTTKQCQALSMHADTIKASTGLPLDPYFSATKWQWLLEHHKDTVAPHLQNNTLALGTIDTWLLWNLTQGNTYATDVTNASRTMLFNIQSLTFDQTLCDLFNIPINILPKVLPSCANFGTYTFNNTAIPIHAVIGDQQSALFAQCQNQPGTLKNTYGTGLFLMANTQQTIVTTKHLITTIAIGINNQTYYAIEGSVFTGGSLIQWLRDNLHIINAAGDTSAMAQSVPNNGGVTIIPALTGLGAPHWQPNATGSILGLTRATTRNHIVRAALEAIALQTQDIIACIQSECPNLPLQTLYVDGGAATNDWLMQCQADVSQLTIKRPSITEATALGAAQCAAHFSNAWGKSPDLDTTTFTPQTRPSALLEQWDGVFKKGL
jgi:glycerol kinase